MTNPKTISSLAFNAMTAFLYPTPQEMLRGLKIAKMAVKKFFSSEPLGNHSEAVGYAKALLANAGFEDK